MTAIFNWFLDHSELVIALAYLVVLGVAVVLDRRWVGPGCHCDDAEQGRACRNCLPPRLPRSNQ